MSKYINADELMAYLEREMNGDLKKMSNEAHFTLGLLLATEAADVEEVNHEKWEKQYTDGFCNGKRNYKMICPQCNFSYLDNHCGMIVPEHFNYCPNCGAKMDGE